MQNAVPAPPDPAAPVRARRALIVDDDEIMRRLIGRLLSVEPDFAVAGAFGSGKEALASLDRLDPDIVILDFEMPDADGLQVAARVLEHRPHQAVVICTGAVSAPLRRAAEELGVRACVEKTDLPLLAGRLREMAI